MSGEEVRQYSIGDESKRVGISFLSTKATGIATAGFLLCVLCMMTSRWLAVLFFLVITLILVAAVQIRPRHRSVAEWTQLRLQAWWRKWTGRNTRVTGPESTTQGGQFTHPGLAERLKVYEGTDVAGRRFAAVVDYPARRATVLLDMKLSGAVDRTLDERNQITAEWARWEAQLSTKSGDVDSAVTVITTRPSNGSLINREIAFLEGGDEAPEIAKEICREVGNLPREGVAEIDAHQAITYKIKANGPDDAGFMRQLSLRLPALYRGLNLAGVRSTPMDAEALIGRTKARYTPGSEDLLEELRVRGVAHGLGWDDIGPSVDYEMGDAYYHDGVWTKGFEMTRFPASTFEDGGPLYHLLSPHPRVVRKSLVMVYRPFGAAEGMGRVESENINARNQISGEGNKAKGASEVRLEHTEAARRAFARGHQLGRRSLYLTTTTGLGVDLDSVEEDVKEMSGAGGIEMHPITGWNDTVFLASLGIGQLPSSRASTYEFLR